MELKWNQSGWKALNNDVETWTNINSKDSLVDLNTIHDYIRVANMLAEVRGSNAR